MVRVGIDIRDLRVAKTGQKTVAEELCRQFAQMHDSEIEFIFFDTNGSVYTGTNKWRIALEHIRYQFWKQVTWPLKAWRRKCDVLFCCDYFPPIWHFGYRTVELFHDAFFLEYPEHYNRSFLRLFHALAMPAAKRCARIMTTTRYAQNRIHELCGFPLQQLVTIPLAAKTANPNIADENMPLPVLPGRKYLLHVGVMEKRKNLPALIQAFHMLSEKGYNDIDLVLVGKGNGKIFSDDSQQVYEAIKKYGLEHRVICTGYLPDAQVAAIYQNAFLYVFPSYNEGFGIPVLEAFRFHIPVIVANNSSLPEVGGDAVVCFDPFDTVDICNAIECMINDDSLRQQLVTNGDKRLRDFSWQKTAKALVEVFKEVAGKSNSQ